MATEFQPYVGPRPFEREDWKRFFGRERESSELLSRVIAHPAVLLYSQSGAGKTSLLNASLVPLLEKEGFEVLPTARVRGLAPADIAAESISNLYVLNVLLSWAEGSVEPKALANVRLAEFLNSRPRRAGKEGPSPRVAIFDQFEELFTFYPERWSDREDFFDQVSEALEADRMMRVIFVMREDYIAELDPYVSLLPEKLRTRFRLERLREESALEAVKAPLAGTGYSFAEGNNGQPGVAEQLINNLLKVPVETAAGVATVVGEFVEPVQLQVVCQNLWQKLGHAKDKVITQEQLQACGDVDQALAEFYEDAIATVVNDFRANEGQLRRWFERTLITPSGTRGTVFRGRDDAGGIPNSIVDELVNQHVIRAEVRGGARWYELTHDRLIKPIIDSNNRWMLQRSGAEQTRQLLEAKAAEWVRRGRPNTALLDEAELLEATRWLESPNAADVGYSEALFALVQASRAQVEEAARERERALFVEQQRRAEAEHARVEEQQQRMEEQARSARRLRLLAAALAVMFILSVVAAGFAARQTRKARKSANDADEALIYANKEKDRAGEQRRYAEEQRKYAESQRILAEDLAKQAKAEKTRAEEQAKIAAAREKLARTETERANKQAKLAKERAEEIVRLNEIDSVRKRAFDLKDDAYEAYEKGDYAASIKKYDAARAEYEKIGDLYNQAFALDAIGRLYSRQSKYPEAEQSYRDALDVLKYPKPVHEFAATVLDDLGLLFLSQSQLQPARDFASKAYDMRLEKSPENPELLESYRILGTISERERNYDQAEDNYQKAVKLARRILGSDDPQLASAYEDLGGFYYQRGKYSETEENYLAALRIRGTSESIESLRLMQDFGSLYTFWGKYAKAEEYVAKTIEIEERALGRTITNQQAASQASFTSLRTGVTEADLARSLNDLGLIYYYRGKYPDAEKAYLRSIAIDENVRGVGNVDPSKKHNLALAYFAQANYAQVEPLENEAAEIAAKRSRSDRELKEANSFRRVVVARLYREQAKFADAERLFREILDIQIAAKGKAHPDVGIFTHYYALVYLAQRNYAKAAEIEESARDILTVSLGADNWRTSVSLSTLATIYTAQGRTAEAKPLFLNALENLKRTFGEDHPEIALTLNGLAKLYLSQNQYQDAEEQLKRAEKIQREMLGPDHPHLAATLNNFGLLYSKQGKSAEAESFYRQALAIREKVFGTEHPSVAETLENYAALLRAANRVAEAEAMETRAKAIRTKFPQLGPDN